MFLCPWIACKQIGLIRFRFNLFNALSWSWVKSYYTDAYNFQIWVPTVFPKECVAPIISGIWRPWTYFSKNSQLFWELNEWLWIYISKNRPFFLITLLLHYVSAIFIWLFTNRWHVILFFRWIQTFTRLWWPVLQLEVGEKGEGG